MKVILADTNIVSILFKLDHALRPKCVEAIDGQQCYVSFMTTAELLLWPNVNGWGYERRTHLSQHIAQFTTLFPDGDTCVAWAGIVAESRRAGRPITTADAWIAATAKRWKLALLTADYRDFEHLDGLTLIPV